MIPKPIDCSGCPLYQTDKMGFSIPEGTCKNGVMIIGEALGSAEKAEALPFRPYAEAGSALQTAFRFLGVDRKDFVLWNMIACQPPFNALEGTSYEYDAINHCKIHFDRVIRRYKPRVIVALGNVPLKHLWAKDKRIDEYVASMPETTKEERKAKEKYLRHFKIGSMRGYILPTEYNIPLISSWHPSYITREKGRTQLGVLMRDIYQALQLAQGKIPPFASNYIEEPTEKQLETFYQTCKNNPHLVISHDIETPLSTIETDESEI